MIATEYSRCESLLRLSLHVKFPSYVPLSKQITTAGGALKRRKPHVFLDVAPNTTWRRLLQHNCFFPFLSFLIISCRLCSPPAPKYLITPRLQTCHYSWLGWLFALFCACWHFLKKCSSLIDIWMAAKGICWKMSAANSSVCRRRCGKYALR